VPPGKEKILRAEPPSQFLKPRVERRLWKKGKEEKSIEVGENRAQDFSDPRHLLERKTGMVHSL